MNCWSFIAQHLIPSYILRLINIQGSPDDSPGCPRISTGSVRSPQQSMEPLSTTLHSSFAPTPSRLIRHRCIGATDLAPIQTLGDDLYLLLFASKRSPGVYLSLAFFTLSETMYRVRRTCFVRDPHQSPRFPRSRLNGISI
jgi:hypothetical protein